MHNIFYSMRAATGMQLKQSIKDFQSFVVYLFLPELVYDYIIKKSHRYELSRLIHGFPLKRIFDPNILFLMQIRGILTQFHIYLYLRNLLKIDKKSLEETLHIKTFLINLNIAHGYLHRL